MRCLHPIELPIVVDGKKTKQYHLVPCGKCYACKYNRQQDWTNRLNFEHRKAPFAYFVTFTYSDEYLPPDGLQKSDMQKFVKRLRRDKPPNSIRYLICGEYGSKTHRCHYHAIFFSTIPIGEEFAVHWPFGFVSVGDVSSRSIAYTCKYTLKVGEVPPGQNETFALMSLKPALGSSYMENDDNLNFHCNFPFLVLPGGYKARLPRYYRDKYNLLTCPQKEKHVITTFEELQRHKERVEAFERNAIRRQQQKDLL